MHKLPLDIETIPGQAAAVLDALKADAEDMYATLQKLDCECADLEDKAVDQ